MKYFKIIIIILFTTFSFGQKSEKIKVIRKIVQSINIDSGFTIKKLDNEYFVNKKKEVTDGGQELTGYFKNGKIIKIVYSLGLSYGINTYEYYFSENQLIFVFHKQDSYLQVKDSFGEFTGFDYTKLKTEFEGRYYFEQSKIFETKNKGVELFSNNDKNNKTSEFLEACKSFVKELK
jgi:hypothetical protein